MARISKALLLAAATFRADNEAGKLGDTKTADILAFHNEHAERFGMTPVKKFKDRAAAEARILELAAAIVAASEAPPAAKRAPVTEGGLAAAISATWADPAVRAARVARHPVEVKGTRYPSIRKAFDALGLDMKAHGRVRAKLVANGAAEFEGVTFRAAA